MIIAFEYLHSPRCDEQNQAKQLVWSLFCETLLKFCPQILQWYAKYKQATPGNTHTDKNYFIVWSRVDKSVC